jgi:cation diffusion facilitator CzcD-associated flavoprotein CzcO
MTTRGRPSILIIGAGFGGIGMAIELRRNGFDDITVLERAADLGGVWRENTYPGAACDVPSPLYSYSFEPKPDWPQRYSGRAAIHAYLRGVAERHGVLSAVRFGTSVTDAEFDDATGRWTVRTADGDSRVVDVLISAVGPCPPYPASTPSRARRSIRPSGTTTSTCAANASPASAPERALSSTFPRSSPRSPISRFSSAHRPG